MQPTRILGIVVLLLLAGAAAWFVSRGDTKVELPSLPDATTSAAENPAEVVTGSAASAETAAGTTVRVEAASATNAAESGAAVIGQVVDDSGRPVAGALVSDSHNRRIDFGDLDNEFFEAIENDPGAAAARVRGTQREGQLVTTDADGRFRLATSGSGGRMSLQVEARGHRVLERSLVRPTAGEFDVGVLELERGAIVRGRVVDRAGNGIAAAKVLREPGGPGGQFMDRLDIEFSGAFDMPGFGSQTTETDAAGWFELPHMAPGEFVLRAWHPEHPSTRQKGLTVAAGGTLADVVLVLDPGAAIRGRVVNAPEGTSSLRVAIAKRRDGLSSSDQEGLGLLAGAGEAFGQIGDFPERTVPVAADGSFEVPGLRIGADYRVWATQSGRGFLGNAACSQRLDVTTPIEGIELFYDAGITVTFQVVDAVSGEPIERLWIGHSLTGGGGMDELMQQAMGRARVSDHPDGRVTMANLRPKEEQELALTVESIGYAEFERKNITLPRRGELDLGVIRLAPAPALHVQVLSQVDGTPVVGADVRVRAAQSEATTRVSFEMFGERSGRRGPAAARTGDDGRCVVNVPNDASFVVVVTSKEHARHETASLSLAALADNDYVVRLLRGGSVEVMAVDSEGAVASAQRIEHVGPDGRRGRQTTNEAGVTLFARLTPGQHRFRIGDGAGVETFVTIAMEVGEQVAADGAGPGGDGWQDVQVDDGATATLKLIRPASAELRGVVRENGVPLAGARIAFLKGPGGDGGVGADLAEMVAGFSGGGSGRSARTGDDGSYRLRELPEGSHRLRITTSDRSMPAIVPVLLHADENVSDIDLDVATVRGIVRDAEGQPLAGAKVRVSPVRPATDGQPDPMTLVEDMVPGGLEMFAGAGGKSTKTDGDGRYELRGVQSGTKLQVRATAKGHAPAESEPFEVASGGARDGVDLQLLQAGRIEVTMAAKTAFVFASASLLDATGENAADQKPVMQMLNNGAGTLNGLCAGRWRVTLRSPSGESPPPLDVDVVAGQTATVAF